VFAAELARALGRIDAERVEAHRRVVGGLYGLGVEIPDVAPVSELMALMGRDKKAIGGLTFVLDGPRGVESVAGVDPATVSELLGSLIR
jgi:5-deoxy-5-amino-3-dehydroquinate synthase